MIIWSIIRILCLLCHCPRVFWTSPLEGTEDTGGETDSLSLREEMARKAGGEVVN
jgi:hypothetical protein